VRIFAIVALAASLVACSQPSSVPNATQALAPDRVTQASGPVVDPLHGVSAHYVVETGTNADGRLQVDVRQAQEPSIFASPSPFTLASVEYPDQSFQRVDEHGMFDAGASHYAAKHGEPIDGPPVTIHIVSPIGTSVGIAFQPTTFRIYVPSEKDERAENSVGDSVAFRSVGNVAPEACKASSPHQAVGPNDVGDFVFTTPDFIGVSFPLLLGSCTTKHALGRVKDYLWVSGSGQYRYTIRYQAPSRTALAANHESAVGEYLDLPGPATANTRISPRYDVACGKTGC